MTLVTQLSSLVGQKIHAVRKILNVLYCESYCSGKTLDWMLVKCSWWLFQSRDIFTSYGIILRCLLLQLFQFVQNFRRMSCDPTFNVSEDPFEFTLRVDYVRLAVTERSKARDTQRRTVLLRNDATTIRQHKKVQLFLGACLCG